METETTKFNWTAFKLSKLITLKKIIPKITFILNPRTGNTWWKKSEEWLPGKRGVGAEGGFAEFAWEEVGGNFLGRWKYIESWYRMWITQVPTVVKIPSTVTPHFNSV